MQIENVFSKSKSVRKTQRIWRATQKKVRLTWISSFDLRKVCESSQNFLSVIFGILGKFRIDIGENYFQKIIFFETKKISRKKYIFRFFWKSFHFWGKFSKMLSQKSKIFEFFFKILIFFGTFQTFSFKIWTNKIFLFFREKVLISKNISKTYFLEIIFTYIDAKFPKDSKNRT